MARKSIEDRALELQYAAILMSKGVDPVQRPARQPLRLSSHCRGSGLIRPMLESPSEAKGIGHHMGKNVTIADGFFADATRRLREAGNTPAQTALAVQALALLVGSLAFESFRTTATTNTLARELDLNTGRVTTTLGVLEKAGLIARLVEGRSRPIILNPRLVYRGADKAIDGLIREYDAAVAGVKAT